MSKRIAILGSTGSIGKNALRVIEALGSDYEIAAISCHSKAEKLIEQVRKFRPKYAAVTDTSQVEKVKNAIGNTGTVVLAGPKSLVEIAKLEEVDIVITAVVGAAGLAATLAAARMGKTLAVANKEPLVMAGELLMRTARENGARILPVDSEHSAIFQCLQAGQHDEVRKMILTSSGGPFRKVGLEDIRNVTVEQALNHPTWDMGPKITIDSATMMNKALEVIEARWLFGMEVDRIEVLIHPESIVHSMVEFVDGSVIAQLGTPDMCTPIQYALTYPGRAAGVASHLKLCEIGKLTFEKPDLQRFRSLALGFEVAKAGGTAPVVFNAANEAAVEQFLAGKIRFLSIIELIERCLNEHELKYDVSLEELLEADAWARREVIECLNQKVY